MHKFTTTELVAQKPSEKDFKKLKRNPIVFILHNIRSLENVGLFFRLADAILAEKIYLTGYTGYPPSETSVNPRPDLRVPRIRTHAESEIAKTAIKTVPFVPWEHCEDISTVNRELRTRGYQLIAAEQTDVSVNFTLPTYRFPLALLFGHERTGLEEDLLKKCDLVIHIPMLGMGNSHNVAIAGTIISYHILHSRVAASKFPGGGRPKNF